MSDRSKPPEHARSRRRSTGRIIAWVGAAVVLVLGALALVLITQTSAVATYVTERALPGLSQRIGRQISVGSVRAKMLPMPRAELTNVTIAGAPGEPNLVEADRLRASVQ